MEKKMTEKPIDQPGRWFYEQYLFGGIYPQIHEAIKTLYRLHSCGVLTSNEAAALRNEIRAELGLEPLDEGFGN